jgi:hypothetical protein
VLQGDALSRRRSLRRFTHPDDFFPVKGKASPEIERLPAHAPSEFH